MEKYPLKPWGEMMGANRQTLSFSGNGYYLASGSRDGVVKPGLPKGNGAAAGGIFF